MKNKINLNSINLHTDLALDIIEKTDVKYNKKKLKGINITEVDIDNNSTKIINKDIGKYVTLEFSDITDIDSRENLIKALSLELNKFIKVSKDDLVLVVGLGNILSTPDSLGPKVIEHILVTNHLYELNVLESNYSRVATLIPDVRAKTGIESFDIISSVIDRIKPSLVIIIDSLASTSLNRLNKTIQITDTNITPGSGIGNARKTLSKKSLGVNTVSIGVPTVVDLESIYSEVGVKKNINLINFFVTPNDIDYIIECLVNVIEKSINHVLHEM